MKPKQTRTARANAYRGLAHDFRIKIAQSLFHTSERFPVSQTKIVDDMASTQANVSQHLSKMVEGGVLNSECEGRNVYFYLTELGRKLLKCTK